MPQAARGSKIDWTSATKDALLWVPAGGHGHPVKHLGLASRCAWLWIVRASISGAANERSPNDVDPFHKIPEHEERRTQEGERPIEDGIPADHPLRGLHPSAT